MQYPESTSAVVEQAWPEPGSLKPRGGHHLEPQGSRAYSSAVPRATPCLPSPFTRPSRVFDGGRNMRLNSADGASWLFWASIAQHR